MSVNFLIFRIKENLCRNKANLVGPSKIGFLVNLNNLYNDTILIAISFGIRSVEDCENES